MTNKAIYHYDPTTGDFRGIGEADKDPLDKGNWLIPANATDIQPPEPVQGKRRVFDGSAWSLLDIPTPSIAEVKAAVWNAIKAKRDTIKAGGVKIGTKWYHTDSDSRIQHLGLKDQARDLLASGQPDTTRLQKLGQDVRWNTMDGSFIYLTVKHAFDIVAAVGDLDALAFTAAETHRVAMEASADPASYDFSGGWPATFPG